MSQRGEIEALFGMWYRGRIGVDPKGKVEVTAFSLPAYINKEGDELDEIIPSFLVTVHTFVPKGSMLDIPISKEIVEIAVLIYMHKGVLVYPRIENHEE